MTKFRIKGHICVINMGVRGQNTDQENHEKTSRECQNQRLQTSSSTKMKSRKNLKSQTMDIQVDNKQNDQIPLYNRKCTVTTLSDKSALKTEFFSDGSVLRYCGT